MKDSDKPEEPDCRLMQADEIKEMLSLPSAKSVHKLENFPAPIFVAGHRRWFRRDVIAWLVTRPRIDSDSLVPGPVKEADIRKAESLIGNFRSEWIRFDPPPISCIYFLMRGDAIVYVGQTVALANRIDSHRKEKQFDGVYYVDCPRSKLAEVERTLIATLRPPLNKVGITNGKEARTLDSDDDQASGERA